ncbi:MAG: NUDIX domain-containing protein [Candidatus Taylorbacteria bacterium]|nr:NUDIX domain-containing protein [Candidatus Taylorbacteria bacterium]
MRMRSAGIVVKDGNILLIHRKNEREYYVLPGGRIEAGESASEACVREVFEESSIRVVALRPVLELYWEEGKSHICYVCEYVSGTPRLGDDTNEAKKMRDPLSGEFYEPLWVPIDSWQSLPIHPQEAKEALGRFLSEGFPKEALKLYLKPAEKKDSL